MAERQKPTVTPATDDADQNKNPPREPKAPPAPSEMAESPSSAGSTPDAAALAQQMAEMRHELNEHRDKIAAIQADMLILQSANTATLPGVAGAGQREKAMPKRAILYHVSAIEGKVFVGEAAIERAVSEGWVDNPSAVKAPPRPA